VFELARQSDIITENFRPGVMESLGFSYEEYKKVNPDIIKCSNSTFGQKWP
jgi:CoA:oxalate CoA-transferase